MKSSFRSFLSVLALVAGIALSEAQAQQTHQWITRELDARDYKLSSYEQNGVYYCSIADQKIIDTQFENGYVLIIFEHAAPRFFLEKEIAPDLLGKLRAIEIGEFYSVLCIHSFFRDDWQERYDAEHTVNARFLNIRKTQGREFVAIP
jgi:hypothetical protein